MQATLQPPVRFGREHVDALSSVISDFQQERARLERFSQELAKDWQLLQDELSGCSTSLEQFGQSLDQRERELTEQKKSAADRTARAEEFEKQLRTTEAERDEYRQQIEQEQHTRLAVRQQLQDVNSGVLSLAELIRVVHSTYSEIDKVQAALGQQAMELMSSMHDEPAPSVTVMVRDYHERHDPPKAEVAKASDDHEADEPADAAESFEASEQHSDAERSAEEEPKPEPSVSDPVIGSVLAELTRLGKK